MTFGHCLFQLGSGGAVSPPVGPGQSPGGGPEDEPPGGPGVFQLHSNKNS